MIVTVCKQGSEFHWEHAQELQLLCDEHASGVSFLVLSEAQLEHNWPRWWSKMEVFKIPGPVLYMDVACRPVGDFAPLLEAAEQHEFVVTRDFNPHQRNVQSCVMAWRGDMSHLYEQFRQDAENHMARYVSPRWWGDQGFIEAHAEHWEYWQDILPGSVVSYKKHCQNGVPKGAKVVSFHGKPKPWEIDNALDA